LKKTVNTPPLSADRALNIAETDARMFYRDLSAYRISLELEDDGWHVDYSLRDRRLKGGGPHYVIDANSGVIASKRYEQ
jgi:hypothetical protein